MGADVREDKRRDKEAKGKAKEKTEGEAEGDWEEEVDGDERIRELARGLRGESSRVRTRPRLDR